MKLRFIPTALAIILLGSSLQSCIFFAGAAIGAAATGAVVFDKRTAKETADDKAITQNIEDKLDANAGIQSSAHIVVASFNSVVLLAGDVPNDEMKEQVSTIAKSVPGIAKLYNQVVISGKPSTLSRVNDKFITATIKTKMVATDSLESSEIQVVTVAGTVFLMGIVSKEQAGIATDIAQHVSGVTKVVRVFQYN
ncbi:MAG: BON domain-containing protein [Gammaproteobacteria bacterium]|nr:BON domain-containing protein [Gammaproteobacteria bacterium]